MQGLILRWAVNVAALFLTSSLVKGIHIDGLMAGLVAAAVLGIINATIRPVISFFTWPLNFLTLGLFPFILNGVMLLLVSGVVKGFSVEGFLPALLGAVVLGFISYLLNLFVR